MKKLFIILSSLILFCVADKALAQRVFMGNAYKNEGFVYEDRLLDDGTRFIMSSMWDTGDYAFSICYFQPDDGDPWYGFAVESKDYIPRNGLIVFLVGNDNKQPIVLGQSHSDNATISRSRTRISPSFIFAGGGRSMLALSSYQTVVNDEASFAIYDISESVLSSLIDDGISDMRISARSSFNNLKPWATSRMSKWIQEAKENVDTRSRLSVNCILEDI